MKNDYVPRQDSELYSWETNFQNEIDGIATTLGIAQADTDMVKSEMDVHQKKYNANVTAQNAAKTARQALVDSRTATVKSIRAFSNRLKNSPGYTEDMGKKLGIIGADSDFDHASAKPHLKLVIEGGNVVVLFNNPREVDGVKIFCKRGNEAVYAFLAVDTESPYEDNRENLIANAAEKRTYYAYFFHDDAVIGQQSDEVSVSITK